jgi:hypothetical protein
MPSMGSLKLLALHPLWLLAAGVVGFGGWVAYDATRPAPASRHASATAADWEEYVAPEHRTLLVDHNLPPLHPGMPRHLAERVLRSAMPDGPATTDTVRGVPVRRVNYLLNAPVLEHPRPETVPAGWSRVTVEYEANHPVQPVLRVSVLSIAPPVQDNSSPVRPE